jgi:predicted nuclease of predicted toxin-antitoxin system
VTGYLLDENLPDSLRVAIDHSVHVRNLGPRLSDNDIWRYAVANNLAIVTKDADFADRIMVSEPPPRVVHLRIGSMRLLEFIKFVTAVWPSIHALLAVNKLVCVYSDRIEAIASP